MLVKKKMKRIDLIKITGINSSALAHMGKDEPVTMNTLGKICEAFRCRLEDIVEYIPESTSKEVQEWEPYSDWELYGSFLMHLFAYMKKRQVDVAPVLR